MTYLNDRQRVELLLLPMMAQSVVISGADDPNSPTAREAVDLFKEAMLEPMKGLDDKKSFSVMRRALRLHEDIVAPFRAAEARVDKVGLMFFYLTQWCIESGYLVLHDGTPMAKGLDILLPAMEHSANIAKLDQSAHKAATKLLSSLWKLGYFQDVPALDYVQ